MHPRNAENQYDMIMVTGQLVYDESNPLLEVAAISEREEIFKKKMCVVKKCFQCTYTRDCISIFKCLISFDDL